MSHRIDMYNLTYHWKSEVILYLSYFIIKKLFQHLLNFCETTNEISLNILSEAKS